MAFRKRPQSVKQIKKNIDFKGSSEIRCCKNCKFFVKDLATKSKANNLKCLQYHITIQAHSVCIGFYRLLENNSA
jgi:hypothetical protein